MVTYTVNLANLPPLTDQQKAELAALATRPDELIDYSDIAPSGDDFWKNAVRHTFFKPIKAPNAETRAAMMEADEIARTHSDRFNE
jgi:hypothetical protein